MMGRLQNGLARAIVWGFGCAASLWIGYVVVDMMLKASRGDRYALWCCLGWAASAAFVWAVFRLARTQ